MLKHLFVLAITAILFSIEPSFIKASTEDVSTSKSESPPKSTSSHSTNDTNCNGEGDMKCKGPNEFYDECPPTCPPQTCDSINQRYNCPLIPATNTGSNCKPACRCIKGYYRNNNNECISEKECSSCCGDPNAEPGCGVNCKKHCDDIGREPGACATVCKENGCDCKDGYYLDNSTGKCVLPSQCTSCGGDPNAKPGCGVNCNKHCNDIGGEPRACIDICYENACDCKEGYYVDAKTGKCVLPHECSTCGGDPNAVPGCSLNCNKQCSTLGRKVICPRIACPPNGCECKIGTYYDKPTKKCVLPKDCCPDQE